MSESLKSFGDLRAFFGSSSQHVNEEAPPESGYTVPAGYSGVKKVGSIVYFRPAHVFGGYAKGDEVRPALVYGVWKNSDGHTEKLELMGFSGNLDRIYKSDFALDRYSLQKEFFTFRQSKLTGNVLYYADNNDAVFSETANTGGRIGDYMWPEILVRRAHALLYSRSLQNLGEKPDIHNLVREGFAFDTLKPRHVRAQSWQPDVRNGGILRKASEMLAQADIDAIAHYANSHTREFGGSGSFPPFEDWPLDMPVHSLRRWSKEGMHGGRGAGNAPCRVKQAKARGESALTPRP
ncbi:MAG: hypothetical protein WC989_04020 [Micavibrio sp.]